MQSASQAHTAASRTMEREDWNQRYAAEELIWTAKANRFLMEETADLAPGSALDMATGEGRNAVWLAEQGWLVRAVDFSDVALAKARRLALVRNVHEAIDFREADLRTYALEAHRFDLVALIYLQIPQVELLPILVRAARAVAPGGTFLLVGHDSDNLAHGYGGPQRAEMLYTAEQVVAALGDELVIEKASRVERPVETPDGIRVALDCLVRAKRL
ncbi:class I SAM-dependent methyltransferase [Rhodoferax lacus]|nr:class I SAM-dependent methyltransferase [Rhodoferax lacus]